MASRRPRGPGPASQLPQQSEASSSTPYTDPFAGRGGRNPSRGEGHMGFSNRNTRPATNHPIRSRQGLPTTEPPSDHTSQTDEVIVSASSTVSYPLQAPTILQPSVAKAPDIVVLSSTSRRQNSYILCVSLLVAFLHTRHHVSFRACAVILMTLNIVFSAMPGNLLGGDTLPRSLTTVFAQLNLTDKFKVHPICYLCHKIFDPTVGSETICADCESRIFRPQTRSLFRRLFESAPAPVVAGDGDDDSEDNPSVGGSPHVVAPIQPLSDALRDLFSRPGVVPAVNAWKTREQTPGELKCMQDGEVWRTIKGPDNKSFFFEGNCDEEIRLGVTFSLDW
ncbi:hypothetical protein B0H16DRAFT_1429796 [Mycena metata]|uniref:Uncharacterized protein n=1 Tax=Mycena metata TaxID=1033252 RepID=A0AAD7HR02_9AGAR|nr:hypothetical protein B0H16DRAFT_1429796 [Mycena metata]